MDSRITIGRDYILVEPQETDYIEILESLAKLFEMPEYLDKNVLWRFRAGPIKTTYEDLFKIKDFMDSYYPENVQTGKKIAIVVESGLHAAMATEFTGIVKEFPLEYKVFSDFASA